ncbi:MAG TPA: hypothetical protein VFE24_16115 [Pirellulales bacterium]|jgi:hypothetical protein|nr:hypothetical protein [Pirellulales bacterium]
MRICIRNLLLGALVLGLLGPVAQGANPRPATNRTTGGTGGGGGGGAQPLGFGGTGGGAGAGGGGAAFSVAPEKFGIVNVLAEKTAQVRVGCVCMKHGAPDPSPQIPYEIMPIEKYSSDAVLQELIKAFGRGDLNQRAAQAATWHVANNLSWEELANKQVKHLNRPAEPYFSQSEVLAARQYVAECEKLAKERPIVSGNDSTSAASSAKENAPLNKEAHAVVPTTLNKHAQKSAPEPIDLFEAINHGQVEVKFIPANDHEARLLITNKTKEALTVHLPDGMAGRPLAKN